MASKTRRYTIISYRMTGTVAKRLAIIGGGPGGLATARVFLNNAPNIEIDLFESDHSVGGLWHYPDAERDGRAMYDHLETNITKHIMKFSGFPFPDDVPTYPWRSNVFQYLQSYYKKFIEKEDRISVHLNNRVSNLSKSGSLWTLVSKDSRTHEQTSKDFDYVVIASGHYSDPKIPSNVEGLKEWFENGAAWPAKEFQNCKFAKDKIVVVVGNGSSGQDIMNQVSTVAKKVYHSVKDVPTVLSTTGYPPADAVTAVPRIKSANWTKRSVELEDGKTLENVDYLIYATGYLYSLPFVEESIRAKLLGGTNKVSSSRLYELWEQIFFVEDPTLAFSLLPQLVVPFPLSELQAALMVKAFNGQLSVPKVSDDEREPEVYKKRANYHGIPDFTDVDYYRKLQSILDKVGGDKDPLKPIKWDEEYKNMRVTSTENKAKRNIVLVKHAGNLRAQQKPYELIKFSL